MQPFITASWAMWLGFYEGVDDNYGENIMKLVNSSARVIKLVLIILGILAGLDTATAQERDSTVFFQVTTTDGNSYIGKVINEDDERIRLLTERVGEVTLRKSDILSITPISITKMKNGSYWFENPQSTRYLWSPNGYGLKRGEGYYQNVWVLFNQFSIGVSDYITVGGGVVPLFLFAAGLTPAWFNVKGSFPVKKDKFNIGLGGLFGAILGEDEAGFGIVYGLTTFGGEDKNLSIGLGYGYASGDWANSPTVTISGLVRTGQRFYLLTENYYIGTAEDNLVLFSMGGRQIINRSGLDFGLFIPAGKGVDSFVAIPWLGLTIPFGQKRENSSRSN